MKVADHAGHGPWKQVGRCVYCLCRERLYQGSLPPSDVTQQEFAEALDAILDVVRDRPAGEQR